MGENDTTRRWSHNGSRLWGEFLSKAKVWTLPLAIAFWFGYNYYRTTTEIQGVKRDVRYLERELRNACEDVRRHRDRGAHREALIRLKEIEKRLDRLEAKVGG